MERLWKAEATREQSKDKKVDINMEPIKITQFRVQDFKGVELVDVEVRDTGLFIIGGECDAGKTSLLDGIMAALGGERFVAAGAVRDGASKGEVQVSTSNGLTVKRSFTAKGSYLTVTDAAGMKGNQGTLDKFISLFALDAPRFLAANDKERVGLLLKALGADLTDSERRKEEARQQRLTVGRVRDRLKAVADSMPHDDAVGLVEASVSDLAKELEAITEHNRSVERENEQLLVIEDKLIAAENDRKAAEDHVRELLEAELAARQEAVDKAEIVKTIKGLHEQQCEKLKTLQKRDASEVRRQLDESDQRNRIVQANKLRLAKLEEANAEAKRYSELSDALTHIGLEQQQMVSGAETLLPGLSVSEGQITYHGRPFSALSHSDQLIVTVSICGAVNPACGFVLLDKLEAMDMNKLDFFGRWLKQKGMQVIATRVSTGKENSIIIASGRVLQEVTQDVPPADDGADVKTQAEVDAAGK